MTSNLEELRRRFQPANGISRRKLEIIQHSNAAFEVRDNDGLVGYAKTVQDLALILGLQFRTPEGARFHLNQIDTEPQVNRAPPVHPEVPEVSQKWYDNVLAPEPVPPIEMDPAAQARARALASKAMRRPSPQPGRDLDPADTYEADDLDNQGDPNVLYSTEPDPELG